MNAIRNVLLLVPVAAVTLAGAVVRAEPKADATKVDGKALVKDLAIRQAQLHQSFKTVRNQLGNLATRMEASSSIADKDKGTAIRKALKLAGEKHTEAKFEGIVRSLDAPGAHQNLDVLGKVVQDLKDLDDDLQKLLELLSGDAAKADSEARKAAVDLVSALKDLRDKQAKLQALTDIGKLDKLQERQEKLAKDVKELLAEGSEGLKQLEKLKNKTLADSVTAHVDRAGKNQDKAQNKLAGGKPREASESMGAAITNLNAAISELEDFIKQKRDEEREKTLATLLARAKKMLQAQLEVQDGTAALDKSIRAATDKKDALLWAGKSNKLASKELEVVKDSEEVVKLIKEEGNAGVFLQAFEGVRADGDLIYIRLGRTETGTVTQATIDDNVETLKDIVKALERALRKPEPNDDDDDNDGGPGGPRKKPKLVNRLQELKMIFAMQKRINGRTTLYGKLYTGEQAPAAPAGMNEGERKQLNEVRSELRGLAERQEKLSRITRDLSKKGDGNRPID